MKAVTSGNKKLLLFAFICLLLLIANNITFFNLTSEWFGQDKIISVVDSYLAQSEENIENDLIKLAELYSLFSMLQSSESGITFVVDIQIGVGQLLAAFTTAIEKATEVAALSIVIIQIIKLILEFSESITPWLFSILLFSGVIYGLSHSLFNRESEMWPASEKFVKIALVFFVMFHLFLPYSLYGTALLAQKNIADIKSDYQTSLDHLYSQTSAAYKKESLKNKTKRMFQDYERSIIDLPHKVETMVRYHTRHMAVLMFEFILLPIGLFVIGIALIWQVLRSPERNNRATD